MSSRGLALDMSSAYPYLDLGVMLVWAVIGSLSQVCVCGFPLNDADVFIQVDEREQVLRR